MSKAQPLTPIILFNNLPYCHTKTKINGMHRDSRNKIRISGTNICIKCIKECSIKNQCGFHNRIDTAVMPKQVEQRLVK